MAAGLGEGGVDEAALASLFGADVHEEGVGAARGAPQLSAGLGVSERADKIMRAEPVAKTTPAGAVSSCVNP